MRTLRLNEALNEALTQEMDRDDSVMVLGEDIARYGGLGGVTAGLFDRFGQERVMDTPISESGFTGMAAGAAMMGMRPVVEMQFTGLITVAMDPIVNTAAKARYVHNGALSAPMVIRTVQYSTENVYLGQAFEAWFTHVAGLKVVAPSTPYDAKGLLITAIRDPDPVIFVEHTGTYDNSGPVPEDPYEVPLGQAAIRREGSDVTLVAWSSFVALAEEAATDLAAEGVDVEVIDLRSLVPFDGETVVASVSKTGRLAIVQEAVRRTGFGAEVAAFVAGSDAFQYLKAPIARVANPGVPVPHSKALHERVLPGKSDVVAAIRQLMAHE